MSRLTSTVMVLAICLLFCFAIARSSTPPWPPVVAAGHSQNDAVLPVAVQSVQAETQTIATDAANIGARFSARTITEPLTVKNVIDAHNLRPLIEPPARAVPKTPPPTRLREAPRFHVLRS